MKKLEIDTENNKYLLAGIPIDEKCTKIIINIDAMETPTVQLFIDVDEVVFNGGCELALSSEQR